MGKFAGLLMIAAGVGTAAYVYPMVGDRSDKQTSDVVAITTGAVPASPTQLTRPPTVVVKPAGQDTQRVVSAQTTPGKLPLAPAGVTPNVKSPAIASVTPAPVNETVAKPIDVPQANAGKRANKADDEARITLTRDIQRELKRVGCFEGAADGTWTPETRQSMKQFINRVNASLPVDEPDHILKTLVQGHPGGACGRSCPSGQAMAGDGKCVPTAIIAAPKRVPAPATREAAVPTPQPVAKASSWEPKVVPAPEPVQKPQIAAIPEPRPEPRSAEVKVERAEPLPGRTSLGATGVPPTTNPPAVTEPQEPKPKRPVIVVKPRQNPDESPTAALPKPTPKPAPSSNTPAIGAIAAIEAPEKPRVRPAPTPPPVVYRAPPPQRVVTNYSPPVYSPPPVFRERPRFGPQIFRELERNGR